MDGDGDILRHRVVEFVDKENPCPSLVAFCGCYSPTWHATDLPTRYVADLMHEYTTEDDSEAPVVALLSVGKTFLRRLICRAAVCGDVFKACEGNPCVAQPVLPPYLSPKRIPDMYETLRTLSGDALNLDKVFTVLDMYMRTILRDSVRTALVKGSFDAECVAFAVRHDMASFSRVKLVLQRREAIISQSFMEL
ncbi:unknown [Feldmannia species virus]|uniref:Uncharacterized protein n=1 Tax=Feldmannia species virus TaxID=39420 RepID=B5LWH8_9PHYC|nr:hypothetical protein FeldSpV_gp089 [Feldmannia species virus]ACH46841.1 unknown [Feldmannia species virus]